LTRWKSIKFVVALGNKSASGNAATLPEGRKSRGRKMDRLVGNVSWGMILGENPWPRRPAKEGDGRLGERGRTQFIGGRGGIHSGHSQNDIMGGALPRLKKRRKADPKDKRQV